MKYTEAKMVRFCGEQECSPYRINLIEYKIYTLLKNLTNFDLETFDY